MLTLCTFPLSSVFMSFKLANFCWEARELCLELIVMGPPPWLGGKLLSYCVTSSRLILEFDLAISSYRLGENKSLLSSSYGREKPPSSFGCELSFDLEATDAPALLPRKLARRYPPFFDEIPSFTIDIRGDVASSFASGGNERPVLAFNRDMPVGFLYIDGELAESMGNADEFLCSLISGYDGLES